MTSVGSGSQLLTMQTSSNPLWKDSVVFEWAQTPAGAAAAKHFVRRFAPLCAAAAQLFATQPRVLRVRAPAAVLGDTHGNLADVRRVFAPRLWRGGPLEMQVPVLFLGDCVGRGHNSPELVAYLFAMALAAPAHVHLLRGNQECRFRNASAPGGDPRTFGAVCAARYGPHYGAALWEAANDVFDCLPLAALIESPASIVAAALNTEFKHRPAVYCAHGGFGLLPAGYSSTVATLLSQPVPLRHPEEVPVVRDTLWSARGRESGVRLRRLLRRRHKPQRTPLFFFRGFGRVRGARKGGAAAARALHDAARRGLGDARARALRVLGRARPRPGASWQQRRRLRARRCGGGLAPRGAPCYRARHVMRRHMPSQHVVTRA